MNSYYDMKPKKTLTDKLLQVISEIATKEWSKPQNDYDWAQRIATLGKLDRVKEMIDFELYRATSSTPDSVDLKRAVMHFLNRGRLLAPFHHGGRCAEPSCPDELCFNMSHPRKTDH